MAFHRVPKKVGDPALVGAADKLLYRVASEAKLRGLTQLSKTVRYTDGTVLYAGVSAAGPEVRVYRPSEKEGPGVPDRYKTFCPCTSAITFGIIQEVTPSQYTGDWTYKVLACSSPDLIPEGQEPDEAVYAPSTRPEKKAKIKNDYLTLVPAVSSDGAAYSEGELVTLIPHPFGVDGLKYENDAFIAGQSAENKACYIPVDVGALIIPVSFVYKNDDETRPVPAYLGDTRAGTIYEYPGTDELPITKKPGRTVREFILSEDLALSDFTIHYGHVVDANRETGEAVVQILGEQEPINCTTIGNNEIKRTGSGQSISFSAELSTFDTSGHIYTAVPIDHVDATIKQNNGTELTNNQVKAIVLRLLDGQSFVICLGRQWLSGAVYNLVRPEFIAALRRPGSISYINISSLRIQNVVPDISTVLSLKELFHYTGYSESYLVPYDPLKKRWADVLSDGLWGQDDEGDPYYKRQDPSISFKSQGVLYQRSIQAFNGAYTERAPMYLKIGQGYVNWFFPRACPALNNTTIIGTEHVLIDTEASERVIFLNDNPGSLTYSLSAEGIHNYTTSVIKFYPSTFADRDNYYDPIDPYEPYLQVSVNSSYESLAVQTGIDEYGVYCSDWILHQGTIYSRRTSLTADARITIPENTGFSIRLSYSTSILTTASLGLRLGDLPYTVPELAGPSSLFVKDYPSYAPYRVGGTVSGSYEIAISTQTTDEVTQDGSGTITYEAEASYYMKAFSTQIITQVQLSGTSSITSIPYTSPTGAIYPGGVEQGLVSGVLNFSMGPVIGTFSYTKETRPTDFRIVPRCTRHKLFGTRPQLYLIDTSIQLTGLAAYTGQKIFRRTMLGRIASAHPEHLDQDLAEIISTLDGTTFTSTYAVAYLCRDVANPNLQ